MSKNFAFTWQPYQHKVPIFDERNGQDFISYGIENDYPYYLLNLYRRSAKHNAIINGKTGFILGKGWTSENPNAAPFIDSPTFPNRYDSLDDLTQKTTIDLEVFNGMALYVTWAKNGTIARLEHCPFEKVRVNKKGDMFYVAEWYDAEMNRKFPAKSDVETIPCFDPNNKIGKQLFYYKVYSPSVKNYPLPEYLGGTAYIELDVEIANFAINEIKNNFFPSAFVNFPNGVPMPEEQADIERAMFAKFGGSDNAGRWMFNFSDGKDLAPEITILPTSDLDKRYQQLEKTVEQNIFVAHRVTSPMLFGVKTEGQLGGKNEMVESYEIFKATYIESRVQIVEKNYNYLASFNGVNDLKLQPVEPVTEQLTEAALLQILTEDELREKAGYRPKAEALPEQPAVQLESNALSGLSASQQDKMLRVVRKYSQGQMTKEQATIMLQGFGLPADQIDLFLGADNDHRTEFSSQEFESVAMAFGEDAGGFEVLRSLPIRFAGDDSVRQEFEADAVNRPIDKKILAQVKKTGKVEADAISRAISIPLEKVSERIQYLIEKGRITIENRIARIANEPDNDVKVEFEIRYRYDWRPEFRSSKPTGTSRDFCQTLMKLNKLYTRDDIDQISSIMGFSVWDRRGGWYTLPGTDLARPSCRHVWNQQVVRRVGNKVQEVKI
jgi:DNA-binding Lrp family transcriptional regulator